MTRAAPTPVPGAAPRRNVWTKIGLVAGVVYLLNPNLGVFEFLPDNLRRPGPAATPLTPAGLDLPALIDDLLLRGEKDVHRCVMEAVERVLLPRVLGHTRGHQAQASELLGLNRATLRHKLRALGLAVDKVVTGEGVREGTDET